MIDAFLEPFFPRRHVPSYRTGPACVALLLGSLCLGAARTPPPPATAPAPPAAGELRAWLAEDRWRDVLQGLAGRATPDAPAELRGLLGQALLRAGRVDEAEAVLAPLVASSGASATSIVALARIRAARGDDEEAARLIERALAMPAEDPRVLFWAADFEADRARAIARLERYLEMGDVDQDRLEAARGSLLRLRALGQREIWVPRSMPERVELPLERAFGPSGQLLGYVLRVQLGQDTKPVRLLLDTGAGGLFVVRRVARKRGFEPLSEETLFGGGGDRRHASERGLFDSVDIGGLTFDNALVTVHDQEFEPHGRYHGLLGLSVFRGYRVTLDLKEFRLLAEKGATLEEGRPFLVFSGQMLVDGRLGEQARGLFLVDTGAGRTLVSRALIDELSRSHLGGPATVRAFGGALEGAEVVSGLEVEFAGQQHQGDYWAVDLSVRNRLAGIELSGFLGLDFWGRSRVVIDTVSQRIQLTPRR